MRRRPVITQRIRRLPMFATCTERELRAVCRMVTELDVPAGTVLTTEGQPGHEFVIVLDGTAAVSVNGDLVATLRTGDHFGEIALLDDGPRTATVVAETPMALAVVVRPDFIRLLDDVPALSHTVLAKLARRVRAVHAVA
jgi:CRP/FNR family cyclic AMP-dependent transcriptional regulator